MTKSERDTHQGDSQPNLRQIIERPGRPECDTIVGEVLPDRNFDYHMVIVSDRDGRHCWSEEVDRMRPAFYADEPRYDAQRYGYGPRFAVRFGLDDLKIAEWITVRSLA